MALYRVLMGALRAVERLFVLVARRSIEIRVLDTVLLAGLHHANHQILVREEDANEGQQHPFVVSRDIDADHGFCGFFDSAGTQGPHGCKYASVRSAVAFSSVL